MVLELANYPHKRSECGYTGLVPVLFVFATYYKMYSIYCILHAAKTCCIAFVFYGETFVYQNCGKTVLCRGESVFIRTSANKCVSAVIYNSFLLPVISRLIKNNG